MGNATITFPMLGEWASFDFSRYFTVFGFKIYWYGVIIAFGFLLAALYVMRRSKEFGLTEDNILEMLLCAVPAAIVFARLYYVVFATSADGTNFYFQNPARIFAIRDGGLAIYGGIIGAVLAVFIYAKLRKVRFGALVDVGGMGLLIGQAIGRWANFVNRECYGYDTDVPWKMGLTTDAGTFYVHPAFLYEFLWNAVGFLLLHFYTKKWRQTKGLRQRYSGQIFVMYLAWYGLGRFFIEGMRTDSLYLLSTGLRASQLLALLCVVCAIIFHIIYTVVRKVEPHTDVSESEAEAETVSEPEESVTETESPESDDIVEPDVPGNVSNGDTEERE